MWFSKRSAWTSRSKLEPPRYTRPKSSPWIGRKTYITYPMKVTKQFAMKNCHLESILDLPRKNVIFHSFSVFCMFTRGYIHEKQNLPGDPRFTIHRHTRYEFPSAPGQGTCWKELRRANSSLSPAFQGIAGPNFVACWVTWVSYNVRPPSYKLTALPNGTIGKWWDLTKKHGKIMGFIQCEAPKISKLV